MWKVVKFAAIALICITLLSCGENAVSPGKSTPRNLSPEEQQLVQSYNAFGLKLFREIVRGTENQNVFISPVSVSMALGMTLNGAAGATEEAMKSTLEFSGMTMEQIDQCYRSLIELLTALDPKVQFRIANSIWYRSGMIFEQPFLDACQTYFNAQITGLDFGNPDAADRINTWVKENTNGKIEEIVDKPINPAMIMFLINAIYFKGAWTYQFDPSLTRDTLFTLQDGSTAPCKMMEQPEPGKTSQFSHLANDRLEAIDLPYADGWFSMTILLPKPGRDIDSLISELDSQTWSNWVAGFAGHEGTVAIPRFKLEYKEKLNNVLSAMGMGIAFTPGADFSRMLAGGGIWIDEVRHKTFVEVNEEGTEAAAVTSVGMIDVKPDTFEMRVDRPFIFMIREKHSGTILFVGKIVNPGSQ
jgi:serpin B